MKTIGVRGLLAMMAMLGAFGMGFALMFRGTSPEIPAWAAALVSSVVGFYFGSHAGSGNGNSH